MTTRKTLNEELKGAYQRLQNSADDPEVALVRKRLRALAEELVSSDEVTDDLSRRINETVAEAKAIYVFDEENNSSSAESSQQPELKSESKESEPVVEQPAQQAAPVAVQSSSDAEPTLNDVMRGIEELKDRQLSDEHRKVLESFSAEDLKLALTGGLEYSQRGENVNTKQADNQPADNPRSDSNHDSFVDMFRQWLDDRRLPAHKH